MRAPSPMPAAESMYTVLEDPEVAPPATAPKPSTMKADLQPRERAVLVRDPGALGEPGHGAHGVEEVGEDQGEHQHGGGEPADPAEGAEQVELADQAQVRARRRAAPSSTGTFRCQPPGFSALAGPMWKMASTMAASDGGGHDADQQAALDLARHEDAHGQQAHHEHERGDGGDGAVLAQLRRAAPAPVARTKPESTKPMNAMNRPIPTVIAALSSLGTARKMAVRAR